MSDDLARQAWHDQQGACYWCRDPIDINQAVPDYKVPGDDRYIVAACLECQIKRSKKNGVMTVGDDTPISPFEVLKREE